MTGRGVVHRTVHFGAVRPFPLLGILLGLGDGPVLGNTLVNFAIAGFGYLLLERTVPKYAEVVSVPLYTLLLLFFGEIVPKQFALRHAERLAPWCARALNVFLFALAPFSRLMVAGSRVFQNLLTRERRALSDDEMRTVVESAAASGELDSEEASMVEGVMRLPDLYALNEMTPRVHLVGVEASSSDAEKVAAAEASDYPYLPIYRGDMDHVEGFLDTERLRADPARNVCDAVATPWSSHCASRSTRGWTTCW